MAKVSNRLASGLSASEEDSVGSLGGSEGQLIKSYALAAGSGDAGSGGLSESESSDLELGDLQETDVVGDGANNHSGLASLAVHVAGNASNGQRRVVDAGHSDSLQDGVSELGISSSGNEAVEE